MGGSLHPLRPAEPASFQALQCAALKFHFLYPYSYLSLEPWSPETAPNSSFSLNPPAPWLNPFLNPTSSSPAPFLSVATNPS